MSSPPNIPDSSVPGMLARSQPPEAWIYDRDPANGIARATFNGEVYAQTINSPAAGVSAFNGRTGSVTLDLADVEAAGAAPLASPAFTGTPTVPTQSSGTSNQTAASTAFVMQAVQQGAGVTTFNGRSGAVQLTLGDVTSIGGAPLASPALSGAPTAPTPVVSDNSSLLATTAYVNNWGAQNTVLSFNGRRGAVTLTLADVESVGGAPIASPSFTGTPVVPTAAPGTSSGQAASCAFVENAITAGVSGVASFNGRTGAVSLTTADVTTAGGAPSLSPVLTGTPTAPTAVAGTNTGQLATCAFVETAIGSIAPIVNSFNGRNGTVTLTLGDVTSVGGAPIASPAFTGTPTVPTAAPGTNTTEAASCAFVEAAIASVAGVSSFNTRQGAVTLTGSDLTGAGGALLASPALTGSPTVNGAAIATQPYVTAQLGNYLPLIGGTLTGTLTVNTGRLISSMAGGAAVTIWNTNISSYTCCLWQDSNGAFNVGPGLATGAPAGGTQWLTVSSAGNGTFSNGVFAGTADVFGLYPQAGSNVIGLISGWYWTCDGSGNMQWATPGGTSWYMRNDHFVYNNVSNVGGQGAYANLCDDRAKENVEPSSVGLDEVRQLQPIKFERIRRPWNASGEGSATEPKSKYRRFDDSQTEIGFSAQQVAGIIPHAVSKAGFELPDGSGGIDTDEPSLAISLDPIVAALVNAVKVLAARIEELEAR